MKLSLALGWHTLRWSERLTLARRAEALGYDALYVDGDISMLGRDDAREVLDGWTATTSLIHQTERMGIGSIRLVEHWNAARLAQATATLEKIAPGRQRFFISVGGQPADRRFGYPRLSPSERIAWLDETLTAVRGLWRGEVVTHNGRFVTLDGARIHPALVAGRIPIAIGAQGPELLQVVAAHADIWDINLPPVPERVEKATETLAKACEEKGRPVEEIARSMWIFTRPDRDPEDPSLREEFRRLNPWYGHIEDRELPQSFVAGSPDDCRRRLAEICRNLAIERPILDLSGLDFTATARAIDRLAPKNAVDASS